MGSEAQYWDKFKDMQKYLPFLENFINRLEKRKNASNVPRETKLSKLKALRALLGTSKRMKFEYLAKCEQVLMQLYLKVEKTDILPTSIKLNVPENALLSETIQQAGADRRVGSTQMLDLKTADSVLEINTLLPVSKQDSIMPTVAQISPALITSITSESCSETISVPLSIDTNTASAQEPITTKLVEPTAVSELCTDLLDKCRAKLRSVSKKPSNMSISVPAPISAQIFQSDMTTNNINPAQQVTSQTPSFYTDKSHDDVSLDENTNAGISDAHESKYLFERRTPKQTSTDLNPSDSFETPRTDSTLFKRRSPKISPRRRRSRSSSPSMNGERKLCRQFYRQGSNSSSKSKMEEKSKLDAWGNIDLKLRENKKTLNNLNTAILNTTMKCDEKDVDIDQLRKVHHQSVEERKRTSANEDISEYILKSYINIKKKKNATDESKTSNEVEVVEMINKNVVIEIENERQLFNSNSEKDLIVVGPDKDMSAEKTKHNMPNTKLRLISDKAGDNKEMIIQSGIISSTNETKSNENKGTPSQTGLISGTNKMVSNKNALKQNDTERQEIKFQASLILDRLLLNPGLNEVTLKNVDALKSILSKDNNTLGNKESNEDLRKQEDTLISKQPVLEGEFSKEKTVGTVGTISEKDILQALYNEIKGSNLALTGFATIPSLSKPKKKIISETLLNQYGDKKRRISLEKYKEKVPVSLSLSQPNVLSSPSQSNKIQEQSLLSPLSANYEEHVKFIRRALTAKEYERFDSIISASINDNINDTIFSLRLKQKEDPTSFLQDCVAETGPKSSNNGNEDFAAPVIIPSVRLETPNTPRHSMRDQDLPQTGDIYHGSYGMANRSYDQSTTGYNVDSRNSLYPSFETDNFGPEIHCTHLSKLEPSAIPSISTEYKSCNMGYGDRPRFDYNHANNSGKSFYQDINDKSSALRERSVDRNAAKSWNATLESDFVSRRRVGHALDSRSKAGSIGMFDPRHRDKSVGRILYPRSRGKDVGQTRDKSVRHTFNPRSSKSLFREFDSRNVDLNSKSRNISVKRSWDPRTRDKSIKRSPTGRQVSSSRKNNLDPRIRETNLDLNIDDPHVGRSIDSKYASGNCVISNNRDLQRSHLEKFEEKSNFTESEKNKTSTSKECNKNYTETDIDRAIIPKYSSSKQSPGCGSPRKLLERGSRDSKKKATGLIYTNDNLARCLLGQSYVDINYKIPKIKRNSVNEDTKSINADDDMIENTLNDKNVGDKDTELLEALVPRSTCPTILIEEKQKEKVMGEVNEDADNLDKDVDTLELSVKKSNLVRYEKLDVSGQRQVYLTNKTTSILDSKVYPKVQDITLNDNPVPTKSTAEQSVEDDKKSQQAETSCGVENYNTKKEIFPTAVRLELADDEDINANVAIEVSQLEPRLSSADSRSQHPSIGSTNADKISRTSVEFDMYTSLTISNAEKQQMIDEEKDEVHKPLQNIGTSPTKKIEPVAFPFNNYLSAPLNVENAIDKKDQVDMVDLPDCTNEFEQKGTVLKNEGLEISKMINNENESGQASVPGPSTVNVETQSKKSNEKLSSSDHQAIDTLSSILSLLKDKTKIMQILSLLDDNNETEKIKKKLSMLAEIESDDEDSKKYAENKNTVKSEEFVESEGAIPAGKQSVMKKKKTVKSFTKLISKKTIIKVKKKVVEKQKAVVKRITKSKAKAGNLLTLSTEVLGNGKKRKDEVQKLQEDIRDMFSGKEVLSLTGKRNCRMPNMMNVEELPVPESLQVDKTKKQKNVPTKKMKAHLKVPVLPDTQGSIPCAVIEKANIVPPLEEINQSGFLKRVREVKVKNVSKVDEQVIAESEKHTETQFIGENVEIETATHKVITDKPLVSDAISQFKIKPGPKSKKIITLKSLIDQNAGDRSDELKSKMDDFIGTTTISKNVERTAESLKYYLFDSEDEPLSYFVSNKSTDNAHRKVLKKKKKKTAWSLGIIKRKNKKLGNISKETKPYETVEVVANVSERKIDHKYFTDEHYCFSENIINYACKACSYVGLNIVDHYKLNHMDIEVPIARLSPTSAVDAEKQSLSIDFDSSYIQEINLKRQCRFCYKTLTTSLSSFFEHIVKEHTGEYNSDAQKSTPSVIRAAIPPSEENSLLLGYICGRCNYTQLSLENLKAHIANRHNDKETVVHTINMSAIASEQDNEKNHTKRALPLKNQQPLSASVTPESLLKPTDNNQLSTRNIAEGASQLYSNKEVPGSERPSIDFHYSSDLVVRNIKQDRFEEWQENDAAPDEQAPSKRIAKSCAFAMISEHTEGSPEVSPADLMQLEHIKKETNTDWAQISIEDSNSEPNPEPIDTGFILEKTFNGSNLYRCAVTQCHFETFSCAPFRRHINVAHSKQIWSGYCSLCKSYPPSAEARQLVLVDALNHFVRDHNSEDIPETLGFSFPTSDTQALPIMKPVSQISTSVTTEATSLQQRPYITEKPLSHHVLQPVLEQPPNLCNLPDTPQLNEPGEPSFLQLRIENVISLKTAEIKKPLVPDISTGVQSSSPADKRKPGNVLIHYSSLLHNEEKDSISKIISIVAESKQPLVLQRMLTNAKILHLYKCGDFYCSYTTSAAYAFTAHLAEHRKKRAVSYVGTTGETRCVYCSYENVSVMDLVRHVLEEHGHCTHGCAYCWYTATAGSLVELHRTKTHHQNRQMVLKLKPVTNYSHKELMKRMRPRKEVILPYFCKQTNLCKYKCYTSAVFISHLELHRGDSFFKCPYCPGTFVRIVYLMRHLREHGLCLYQCPYCLHGTITEIEMLNHMAEYHPNRRAVAHLRYVIEKVSDNNERSKYKTLPLVNLNETEVEVLDNIEHTLEEDPIKEVENSNRLRAVFQPEPCAKSSTKETADPYSSQREDSAKYLSAESTATIQSREIDILFIGSAAKETTRKSDSNTVAQVTVEVEDGQKNVGKDKETAVPVESEKPAQDDIICLDSDDDDVVISNPHNENTKKSKDSASKNEEKLLTRLSNVMGKETIKQNNEVITLIGDEDNMEAATTAAATQTPLQCARCSLSIKQVHNFKIHITKCYMKHKSSIRCKQCQASVTDADDLINHIVKVHRGGRLLLCDLCGYKGWGFKHIKDHMWQVHKMQAIDLDRVEVGTNEKDTNVIVKLKEVPHRPGPKRKMSMSKMPAEAKKISFGPQDIDELPLNPILDEIIYCSKCKFGTKVRSNMLRHLQLHASEIAVPSVAPVNPVPHLETNEKHFDKMANLALSSNMGRMGGDKSTPKEKQETMKVIDALFYPKYMPDNERYVCGALGCQYISLNEMTLKHHFEVLHQGVTSYKCVHCPSNQQLDTSRPFTAARIVAHLKMHDMKLYACSECKYYHRQKHLVERHLIDKHGNVPNASVCVIREAKEDVLLEKLTPVEQSLQKAQPTMDLKPWRCKTCKYKTLLRSDVLMKYRKWCCPFCAYKALKVPRFQKHSPKELPAITAIEKLVDSIIVHKSVTNEKSKEIDPKQPVEKLPAIASGSLTQTKENDRFTMEPRPTVELIEQ